ncbi:MAG: hypothetical protein H7144_05065, partial [Burkholderiales bacterium]|nr:hypothetical protein [Phycisphaerae bacterium]
MSDSTVNPLSARWLTLLRAAPVSSAAPVAVEFPQLLHRTFGQHRAWIIACLQSIDAIRRGAPIVFNHPIPRIPLPAPASLGSIVANAVWLAY